MKQKIVHAAGREAPLGIVELADRRANQRPRRKKGPQLQPGAVNLKKEEEMTTGTREEGREVELRDGAIGAQEEEVGARYVKEEGFPLG